MKAIRSRDNPLFKSWHRLATSSRQRRKTRQTLLDGPHLLRTYLQSGRRPLQVMLNAVGRADTEISGLLREMPEVPVTLLADGLFQMLSELKTPSGVLALIPVPEAGTKPAQRAVWLEDIQDPGNLGSILRTAAAASFDAAYLSAGCADAWSPKVLRAAMGGHFMLDIHERVDLLQLAAAFDGTSYATSLQARRRLYDCDLRGRLAFAFGNEGSGLSPALQEMLQEQIIIPISGVESLNVAAAAAICMFEVVRQRG